MDEFLIEKNEHRDREEEEWDERKNTINRLVQSIQLEASLRESLLDLESQKNQKKTELEDLRKKDVGDKPLNIQDLKVTAFERDVISRLENRVKKLGNRAQRIAEEIDTANARKSGMDRMDTKNFQVKDTIHDLLYQNKILERHIQSEHFRTFDETIAAMKYNHSRLVSLLKLLESSKASLQLKQKQKNQVLLALQEKLKGLQE